MSAYVYRVRDDQGRLLYIGCTTDPESRFRSHRSQGSPWLPYASSVSWAPFPSKAAGHAAEAVAIGTERPRFNIRHNQAGSGPFPDAEPSGVTVADLLCGAPGRVETVHDRKRVALRRLSPTSGAA